MTYNQSNKKNKKWNIIILLLSIFGLIVCITLLFPQTRQIVLDWAIQVLHKEPFSYEASLKLLLSLASGGICFILFFDYCTLTNSGKALSQQVIQEIKDCLSEIDFKVFIKPVLLMFGIYLLGVFTIIRANFLYEDDIACSITGIRRWYDWNRYVVMFLSYIIHPEIRITDISPIPQLLAALVLSCSSVILVYIIGKKKITSVRLLASISLGLSPFFLECLSYKFDSPYMALSILSCIIPFLFITRKRAFFFISVVSLIIMCMTYQVAASTYIMIVIILCFQDWNNRKKTDKEILSFLGMAAVAFCFSMLLFKFFIMKSFDSDDYYTSTKMYSIIHFLPGVLNNIKNYAMTINQDLGVIWKIGIALVCVFFIAKSVYISSRNKILSFILSFFVIVISFIISYGLYLLLEKPLYAPRALNGFGVFLALLCVFVVSNYKKIATIAVLALNWCFFVFAFSYGNALADQARYAKFREGLLLHDLNTLYIDHNNGDMSIQLKNTIDYTPTIKNIAKHNPIIERLVPIRLGETKSYWEHRYFMDHYNYNPNVTYINPLDVDFDSMDLPVVLDSYYHTIKSDGEHILVILKH